jgi:PAS domain S-box-containing protein
LICYKELINSPNKNRLTKEGTMDFVINQRTKEKIFKAWPVNEEVIFDGGVMITETDPSGIITYANRKFREMTGFSKEELIGSPHSINRHPDMPKGAFRGMWRKIASRQIWNGYVKNLRKDGKYYWVHVYIQPKLDKNGGITGYIAGRKVVVPQIVKEIERMYKRLYDDTHIDHQYFSYTDIDYINEERQNQRLMLA